MNLLRSLRRQMEVALADLGMVFACVREVQRERAADIRHMTESAFGQNKALSGRMGHKA